MWIIVLLLANVILNIADARYINTVDKEKHGASKEDREFASLEKRQQITGELEIGGQKFESLGCWRDAWSRSLPTLEGEHYLLMDPNYKGRRHALFKCARAALDKGYKLFGIENGGQCFASAGGDKRYHKYGASKECKGDGKGGPWSLQVYRFLDQRDAINGGYGHWSSWGTCSKSCAGGVRRRMRKCSNPAPSNGGRDCRSLGPSVETQDCNVKSCNIHHVVDDSESHGSPSLSSKRDESQLESLTHPSPLEQTNSEINNHQEDHASSFQDNGALVNHKQKSNFNINAARGQFQKEVGKYVPAAHATNNQEIDQPVGQKEQTVFNNNGYQSMSHETSEKDTSLEVSQKQQPLYVSSLARPKPNFPQDKQVDSITPQSSNEKEPSTYGNPGNGGNGKLGRNDGAMTEDLSQAYDRIGKGTMKSIPSDKIYGGNPNTMITSGNRENQKGTSSVGNSLTGISDKIPMDVNINDPKSSQQHSNNFENIFGDNQGIEIRITPSGNNIPKQSHNVQKMENQPQGEVPAEISKQHLQNVMHDSNRAPAKSEKGSSEALHSTQNSKTVLDEEEPSSGDHDRKPATGSQSIGDNSQKDDSKSEKGSQSLKTQHMKPMASHFSPNADNKIQKLPQQKLADKEKQDPGQMTGKESSTSNQLQGSVTHPGEKDANSNHFSSKGSALLLNKENSADIQSSQHVQSNLNNANKGGSTSQEKQPQKVSDSSKVAPSSGAASAQKTPDDNKKGSQESDQEQSSQEQGEPVPVVDLDKASEGNGGDYGPPPNEVFSGPVEDTGVQNQPEPDSHDVSQPSGPVYDNEAIQGISDMSQREDQNVFQQANSESQVGPDEGMGAGYDEMGMPQAYTGERTSDKQEDETIMQERYQGQNEAPLTSDYYNTKPAGDCLCPKKECSAKADIAFLVDGSANIPQPYYARVLEFIKIFSRGFDKSNIHVGMMAYGDDVKTALDLKALTDFKQFDDAMNIAPYMGGRALTGNALSKIKTGLFATYGRQDAPRALILLSSGGSADDVVAPGEELRDSGVKVTAIGLGKQANVRELITVASEPKSEHVFTAFLDTLPNAMDEIIQGICRDVMGIVRDRQEPCTCETYNSQGGPSYDYNKGSTARVPESIRQGQQQEQESSYRQGQKETEGTKIATDRDENLNQQFSAGYQRNKSSEGSRPLTEASRLEGGGRIAYGQRESQAIDLSEKLLTEVHPSEMVYVNEHQNTIQGDTLGKLDKQGNNQGQEFGSQERRPLGTQRQQSRIREDQYKVADEKAHREDEEDSLGSDDYSTNLGYHNSAQEERLKNNSSDRAKDYSPDAHRFASGFPEHYKPHVSNSDEKPSNQSTYVQQGEKQSSETHNTFYQATDDHQGDTFQSTLASNQERMQGSGLHSHPAFLPSKGNDNNGRPFTQLHYPLGSSKGQDNLSSDDKRPTKVIAVGKPAEYTDTSLQEPNRQGCNAVNLGVVLDSTASPGGPGNQQTANMMELAKKASHLFPVSSEGNSVGMVVYGGSPQPSVVHFDKFLDQQTMDEAIDNASNPSFEIRIGKALTLAQKTLFGQLSMSKRNVLLLITDGDSFDEVSRPAMELKRRGIEVFCLGVGEDVNRAQLDLIASEPKKNHVFLAPFNDSDTLMERIRKEICLAANKSPRMQTQRKCPSDLGFIVDGSRSIEVLGKGNFKKMLAFVKNVSLGFHISPEDTRVGVISYGTEPKLAIPFNKYITPIGLALAIENISYPGTITMTGKALELANQKLFDKGSRINVPKVLVVLSEGTSRDSVQKSAQDLRKAGVTVISVGFGPVYNDAELDNIASIPASYYVIKAKFNELQHKVNEVQDKICGAKNSHNKLI